MNKTMIASDEAAQVQAGIQKALKTALNSGNATALKDLAKRYPIFSKGWLMDGVKKFSKQEQTVLKSIIEQWIKEASRAKKKVTLIPVGGPGRRFAPFSWATQKPFCSLFGKSNFIWTLERTMETGTSPEDIFFFIEERMIGRAKQELETAGIDIPDENFIHEKYGRLNGKKVILEKTAMFAMAAVYIAKLRGEETVIVTERTDLVLAGQNFGGHKAIMRELGEAIERGATIAALEPAIAILGNPPLLQEKRAIADKIYTRDLNKGYILPYAKEKRDPIVENILSVHKFHEKPKTGEGKTVMETGDEIAKRYLREGAVYNGSYFIFRADYLLKIFAHMRPRVHKMLMELSRSIGTAKEERISQKISDYFCSDRDRKFEDRKNHLSFEHAIVQALAPFKGRAIPQAGVAVSFLGLETAKNWVGSQGTLKAVWPWERVEYNYIRAEAYDGPHDAIRSGAVRIDKGVKGCLLLLAPEDKTTRIHVAGANDLAIAYERRKKALIVVPVSKNKAVENITRAVQADARTRKFTEPGEKAIPSQARETVETIKTDDNILHIYNNGFGVILNSDKTVVYCEEGITGVTGLSNTTIIKEVQNGIDTISVYGPEAKDVADIHLNRCLYTRGRHVGALLHPFSGEVPLPLS